jgi:hypothetical protein
MERVLMWSRRRPSPGKAASCTALHGGSDRRPSNGSVGSTGM